MKWDRRIIGRYWLCHCWAIDCRPGEITVDIQGWVDVFPLVVCLYFTTLLAEAEELSNMMNTVVQPQKQYSWAWTLRGYQLTPIAGRNCLQWWVSDPSLRPAVRFHSLMCYLLSMFLLMLNLQKVYNIAAKCGTYADKCNEVQQTRLCWHNYSSKHE